MRESVCIIVSWLTAKPQVMTGPIISPSPLVLSETCMFRTLAIVGVGLIGGSIALAARARGVAQQIIGIGPSRFHLEAAVRQGMLDTFDTELKAAGNADAAIVCTPVNQIAQHVAELVVITRPGTLITDVGSTKAGIVRTLAGASRRILFCGRPSSCWIGKERTTVCRCAAL